MKKNPKSLVRLTKKKTEKTQIIKVRSECGDSSINLTAIKSIIIEYDEQLYTNQLDNPEERDKFLETYYDS